MYAYLIVLGISPLEIDAKYDSLPLHCTLVHWFWLQDNPEVLVKHLEKSLGDVEPIVLEVQGQQTFTGKTRQGTVPVTVNDITATPELRKLHKHACDVLESLGVRYSEPQYVHDGFHPHVTHQKDGYLKPGDVHVSTELYLVEAGEPEYGNERTVRAAIRLSATR